ncbi:hypothetical protein [Dyadobacter bucti]|uniref:hypothetical protein n=1 Tax=Dyadobacter bucti TaxID=2572203 RepID=UPI001109B149|nr:hypothetical protein [Dyadobacter bucti]
MHFQTTKSRETPPSQNTLPWIRVCENSPYFEDENGATWTPVGQNDAITWPDFQGLFKRKNVAEAEGHLAYLAAHGVTCLRMMMEYCQTENRYLEKPVGKFQPNMVQFWDDLFLLCEKYQIRILLTPFDTFWMARRWKSHPYNQLSDGPCKSKFQWLTCPRMLAAIKDRFTFFLERWGTSGVLFGWDLWNEINPLHAGKSIDNLKRYIEQLSIHIREKEMQLYQRSRPQTVSVFAPLLSQQDMNALVFQHPSLDFASTHFYHAASIDYPRNVHSAAATTGLMVRQALQLLPAERPFFDSEHGPITYFRRNRKGLPEDFDDAYFLHMQWAHFASGAAGGGMRWPYRHPHVLTHGMRRAQLNLSAFTKLIDWKDFRRVNLNEEIFVGMPSVQVFGCGDNEQAIVWMLSVQSKKGNSKLNMPPGVTTLSIPGLADGDYHVVFWDTKTGITDTKIITKSGQHLEIQCMMESSNMAVAVGLRRSARRGLGGWAFNRNNS